MKIHRLLQESRFRTRRKEEADLFFVPTYTKCVRMLGGLNDKEINQTYVKVNSLRFYLNCKSWVFVVLLLHSVFCFIADRLLSYAHMVNSYRY